ncbi:MAG: CopG family transcriptional regulator [Zoogloeaceae bacterium]|jgi:predicted transcriptional regulator|nr:CopG family transcriptional regulator [Zoogloeaceae bacterium]
MSTATTQISVRISADDKARLNKLAALQKKTAHALAAEAIQFFLLSREQELAWNTSCLESLRDYQETGLHVTHEEVDAWLASWGTEAELPAPTCHE